MMEMRVTIDVEHRAAAALALLDHSEKYGRYARFSRQIGAHGTAERLQKTAEALRVAAEAIAPWVVKAAGK